MQRKKQLVECVPNFSEGRDAGKIEQLLEPFRGKTGVKLLDYSADYDHNRLVVTLLGEPQKLLDSMHTAMSIAVKIIDLKNHAGQHPRMGAVDVIPFIPLRHISIEETVALSKQLAQRAAADLDLPVFLYEKSASQPLRANLAMIRKGQFEGMKEKLQSKDWIPDYGPATPHPSAGVCAIGARVPLIAFNVNLHTKDKTIAESIAKKIRQSSGGFQHCKAIGINIQKLNQVQVSMNLTDYSKTAIYRVFELIKIEANRYGISVASSEIIGLTPMAPLIDAACYYLSLNTFEMEQVLENRIFE